MKRWALTMAGAALVLGGCVTQRPWQPTVDFYGATNAQNFSRDLEECRSLARQVSGSAPQEAVQGAVTGGLVGAAAGAAIGAAFGSAGRGAAVGAAAGGIGNAASRGQRSEAQFRQAYVDCMRRRGHNVVN